MKLCVAIKLLINDDPLFAKPFWYRGDCVDDVKSVRPSPGDGWWRYALALSGYPNGRLKGIQEEFTKDRRLHVDVLIGLTEESGERRYGGGRFYLRALGYSFLTPLQVRRPPTSVAQMEADRETKCDEG